MGQGQTNTPITDRAMAIGQGNAKAQFWNSGCCYISFLGWWWQVAAIPLPIYCSGSGVFVTPLPPPTYCSGSGGGGGVWSHHYHYPLTVVGMWGGVLVTPLPPPTYCRGSGVGGGGLVTPLPLPAYCSGNVGGCWSHYYHHPLTIGVCHTTTTTHLL